MDYQRSSFRLVLATLPFLTLVAFQFVSFDAVAAPPGPLDRDELG